MFDSGKINRLAFSYYKPLRRVEAFVDRNLTDTISLRAAASHAGLEEHYFSSFFHAKAGVCFSDWLTYLRVKRAKELLRERDYNITQVALAVGYRDLTTFARAFKRQTASTPSAFKDTVRP